MKKIIASTLKTLLGKILFHDKRDYNLWIFSSTDNNSYNYNSKYLFQYVKNNEPSIQPCYVINDDLKRKELQRLYGEEYFMETKSLKGIRKALRAGAWFTSAGLPLYCPGLLKNRIIINLWHGVPLKKIVLQEEGYAESKKLFFKSFFSNNYTYTLTTSSKLIPIMKKSFGIPGSKVKVWGQPRNDELFIKDKARKRINSLLSLGNEHKKLILYAPTYRDKGATEMFPFEDFDKEELSDLLEREEAALILRHHLKDDEEQCLCGGNRIFNLEDDMLEDIMEVLEAFQVLITDYSSIYIDYLLLMRPIIFIPYDKEEYLKNRGLNFPYDSVTPGPKVGSFKEFKDALQRALSSIDGYEEERRNINDLFNDIKGACSESICAHVMKEIEIIKNGGKDL